jgi:hypothetical protein
LEEAIRRERFRLFRSECLPNQFILTTQRIPPSGVIA